MSGSGTNQQECVIRYDFTKKNGNFVRYKIVVDEETLTRKNVAFKMEHANWTRMEHNQCEHCPLSRQDHPHCPAAVAVSELINDWEDTHPNDEVHMMCRTKERKVSTHASVQNGLSAVLGLVLATSECPHFDFFKPMARFHLPLATPSESYYRVLGNYFVQQFFSNRTDMSTVLEDIKAIYDNVELVNQSLSKRLYHLNKQHTTVSALVVLDLLAKFFSVSPEDSLHDLERIFKKTG